MPKNFLRLLLILVFGFNAPSSFAFYDRLPRSCTQKSFDQHRSFGSVRFLATGLSLSISAGTQMNEAKGTDRETRGKIWGIPGLVVGIPTMLLALMVPSFDPCTVSNETLDNEYVRKSLEPFQNKTDFEKEFKSFRKMERIVYGLSIGLIAGAATVSKSSGSQLGVALAASIPLASLIWAELEYRNKEAFFSDEPSVSVYPAFDQMTGTPSLQIAYRF